MKRLVMVGVGATQLSLLEGLAAGHVRPWSRCSSVPHPPTSTTDAARVARRPARRSGDVHRPRAAGRARRLPLHRSGHPAHRRREPDHRAHGRPDGDVGGAVALAQLDSLRRAGSPERPNSPCRSGQWRVRARSSRAIERAQQSFEQREIRIAVARGRRPRLRDGVRHCAPGSRRDGKSATIMLVDGEADLLPDLPPAARGRWRRGCSGDSTSPPRSARAWPTCRGAACDSTPARSFPPT